MDVFVIKDELGNYASRSSFQQLASRWLYVSVTGKCDAMRWYLDEGEANETIKKLLNVVSELGLSKVFTIHRINTKDICEGEILKKEL